MRILVHEFVSGGGLAGRRLPGSLAREGAAMRDALVTDLAALPGTRVLVTVDPRCPFSGPQRGVEVVALRSRQKDALDQLMEAVDAAWVIAPETGGCLEALASRAERRTTLIGSGPVAIRRASDKASLSKRLARAGIQHPSTRVVPLGASASYGLELPLVFKPSRGAGCEGVALARTRREVPAALSYARRASRHEPVLAQSYIEGTASSVSLLSDGRKAVPLAVNAQKVSPSARFAYRGGSTPLDHRLSGRAADVARRVVETLGELRGYVGVDLVLTETDAIPIEVNPRLTTAYLGLRSALDINVAGLILEACEGRLPRSVPVVRRCVGFSPARVIP